MKKNSKEIISELELRNLPVKEQNNYYMFTGKVYLLQDKSLAKDYSDYLTEQEYNSLSDTEKQLYYTFSRNYILYDLLDNIHKKEITESEYNSLPEQVKKLYYLSSEWIKETIKQEPAPPIKDIYYINKPAGIITTDILELHVTLDKSDKETKDRSYISIHYKLADILIKIATEYEKEYLYYKPISKIADNIKKLLQLQDTEIGSMETIEFIKEFSENISMCFFYNLYEYNKRQTKKEYKRYYDISLDIYTGDCPNTIFFTGLKEFNSFKKKIKDIYLSCEKLLRDLIIENEKETENQITANSTFNYITTPEFKNIIPYMNGKLVYEDDFTKMEITAKIGIPENKLFIYLMKNYNENTNISTVNLKDYAFYKNINENSLYDFYENIDTVANNLGGTRYSITKKSKDGNAGKGKNISFSLFKSKRIVNKLTVRYEKEFQDYLINIHKNLLTNTIQTKILALPDKNIVLNEIALYLNNYFYYGKKTTFKGVSNLKYINQNKDKIGIYAVISIKKILEHTKLQETLQNNYFRIYEKFDTAIYTLYKNGIISDYEIVSNKECLPLKKDLKLYKPKEKLDLYLKYYIDK